MLMPFSLPQTPMTIRIDSQQKAMFDNLCEQFGMSANTAINIFVRQVIRLRRIPFIISATEIDEDLRAEAIQTIREIREDAKNRPEMTLEEINAEINAVREARRQTDLRSYRHECSCLRPPYSQPWSGNS